MINSASTILAVSERGQITIPIGLRKNLRSKYLVCTFENNSVVLRPLQTKDEFLEELKSAKKDRGKNGGLNLSQMKKKYSL